ncbi:MAG: S-methyl-5-thioribose-1-phosphate isomerase, partial [Chloroflexi bacterium]|nr:S-methyl-5-thioribose-1-phosphate isomerase [Chloroflexota bacterium]
MTRIDYQPIEWLGNRVKILDQTRLPQEEIYLELSRYQDVAAAITQLKIRGAPAIGVAAAYAIALGALAIKASSKADFLKKLQPVSRAIAATRPTAHNLFRAIDRMQQVAEAGKEAEEIKAGLIQEAVKIHSEEAEATRKLSR